MTLEKLLNCSAAELEKMSDAELAKHCEPFLKITRPELAPKPDKQTARRVNGKDFEERAKLGKAKDILSRFGMTDFFDNL